MIDEIIIDNRISVSSSQWPLWVENVRVYTKCAPVPTSRRSDGSKNTHGIRFNWIKKKSKITVWRVTAQVQKIRAQYARRTGRIQITKQLTRRGASLYTHRMTYVTYKQIQFMHRDLTQCVRVHAHTLYTSERLTIKKNILILREREKKKERKRTIFWFYLPTAL